MVEVAPFKAFRLTGKSKYVNVSDFICPPYDVIKGEQREALVKKSKNNVVLLELPEGPGNLKYLQAAKKLRQWKEQEWIQQDRRASFYLLETTYKIKDPFAPSTKLKRYGVLLALRLEIPGKGAVRPHEKTLPKAKADRLNLMNALQTNVSPIFGLFWDQKLEWKKYVKKAIKAKPLVKGKEDKNTDHRMWKIDDPAMQDQLQTLLRNRELFIADGHHRYEVAWAYKESRLKVDPSAELTNGWQYVMTYVCPMEEKGLLMLPTHRFVKTKNKYEDWRKILDPLFKIKAVKNTRELTKTIQKSKPSERVMGWVCNKGCFILKLKEGISIDRCLPNRPKVLRQLDVVLLHDIILGEAKGAQYTKDKDIFFTQDVHEMPKKIKKDPSWVGFVLRSAGVESLAKVASAGEVMPPKTTYFYPKVPTGVTLMPLDRKIF